MNHLANLNPAQKQAVTEIEGPVLVIAGPGTGKTQVLTMRIAEILKSGEYKTHLKSAVDVSNRWYGTTLDADTIDFKNSPILNLAAEQTDVLSNSYAGEDILYFRGQKPFDQLMEGLGKIREQFL